MKSWMREPGEGGRPEISKQLETANINPVL